MGTACDIPTLECAFVFKILIKGSFLTLNTMAIIRLIYFGKTQFKSFLIGSSVKDKVANRAANEENCCAYISPLPQKNSADDHKHYRYTEH